MRNDSLPTELTLRELMQSRRDEVTEIALAARNAVLKSSGPCSELIYETYAVSIAFTFTGKLGQAFIHIATYANHVNLGFNRGVDLDDPDGLLKGTGKKIRHLRLESSSDLKRKPVKNLISAAIAQGWAMAEEKGGAKPPTVQIKRAKK